MEDERMDPGHRRGSYGGHDRDPRMQNHLPDYDPYEIDSRRLGRSGHYATEGQPERGQPNMKTLLANQQLAGRRNPNGGHQVVRDEGPNWILIAGGAIVTVIGVLIVKRQKPPSPKPKAIEKSLPACDDVHLSGLSFTRRESTGSRTSELSAESPYSGDPFMMTRTLSQSRSGGSRVRSDWCDEDCCPNSPPATYYEKFGKGPGYSNRIVITPTSPPGSYRGADTSATECNDSTALSPPARLGFSSRQYMVHRLRQQLKSRDEMILDMQAQISEQERIISAQQAQCRDLESRLEEANSTIQGSNHEIQRLRKAVSEYLAGNSSSAELHQQDDAFLLREARRLAEELQAREEEKQELERLAVLRIKEHELVVKRLETLEAQLEEARNADFGKDLLLDAYEVEHENLEDRVDNLKRLIEIKSPAKNSAPSMIGRNSLPGGLGTWIAEQQGNREDTDSLKAEDFKARARNLVRSYSLIFERNGELLPSPRDINSLKGLFRPDESSSNGDVSDESEGEDANPVLSEKLVRKLKQEVEQLSVSLAGHCDTICEKRLEKSRLVDEFQKRMDEDGEATIVTQAQQIRNHPQDRSFASDDTSAAQVQELSHKLEEIAKRQRVEEEIVGLSRHQVKIAELKQRVEKLLNRCKTIEDSKEKMDVETRELAMNMAATGFELAKQLDQQEEQAKQTSREVQRLSASFELSSPYVPRSKKEELRKMLQDCSSESSSPPLESGPPEPPNMSRVVTPLQSRFSTASEGKPKEIGDNLFDRAISVSSAEPATTTTDPAATAPEVEGGLSAHKSRRGFPINPWLGKQHSTEKRKGPTTTGPNESLEISSESSFEKFVFEIETGDQAGNIPGLSRDMLNAIKGSPQRDTNDKNPEPGTSGSSVSMDSSTDALLTDTLDDLVLVCSAPASASGTPRSQT